MKNINKIITLLLIFIFFQNNLSADVPYYVDFKYILNQSSAGKGAQKFLKDKLNNGIKKIQDKEKNIQVEEKKIIQQKKLISADEYKNKVLVLRARAAKMQKNRQTELSKISKTRDNAKTQLLKKLKPIIRIYMKEKKIRMVLDKKAVLLGDVKLDITAQIIELLNKDLKSLNIK